MQLCGSVDTGYNLYDYNRKNPISCSAWQKFASSMSAFYSVRGQFVQVEIPLNIAKILSHYSFFKQRTIIIESSGPKSTKKEGMTRTKVQTEVPVLLVWNQNRREELFPRINRREEQGKGERIIMLPSASLIYDVSKDHIINILSISW